MPCAAHSLELGVNKAIVQTRSKQDIAAKTIAVEDILLIFENNMLENLEDDVSVYTMLKKCKRIVDFFHRSPLQNKNLMPELRQRNQPETKLIQYCYTRWNSSYLMLESINKSADAITIVSIKSGAKVPHLKSTERQAIPEILIVIKPFVDATEKLSGDKYSTMSLIIPCTKLILLELDDVLPKIMSVEVIKFHSKLIELTKERLLIYETRTISAYVLCKLFYINSDHMHHSTLYYIFFSLVSAQF